MSMPQPIHVALVGASPEQVKEAAKHFRLSAPGIGAAYLATLDAADGKVIPFESLPRARIDLWICLDQKALNVCEEFHKQDRLIQGYGHGLYEALFPEACVLVEHSKREEQRKNLALWAKRVTDAWLSTS